MDVRINNSDVNVFGELSMGELESFSDILSRSMRALFRSSVKGDAEDFDSAMRARSDAAMLHDDVSIEIVRRMMH